MMLSISFIYVAFLAIGHCSTIPEMAKADATSIIPDKPSSTGQPEGTTRGPHTHEEHPVEDPDHSDHAHTEEPKAPKTDEGDHKHPGPDHPETGHDLKMDQPEEDSKVEEKEKSIPSEEVPKKEEEKVKDDQEGDESRSKRGLWRRRLD